MKLILHAGAHFTEEGRLMKCLLRNADHLSAQGVMVPGPGRYRELLRKTFNAMRDGTLLPLAREELEEAIFDKRQTGRVVLSNANLFGVPRAAIHEGYFYPKAAERMEHLRELFPDVEMELYFALRNPASFLSHLHEFLREHAGVAAYEHMDPRGLRWSILLKQIRDAAPDVPITVWCAEDAPLIWGELVRDMSGLDPSHRVTGAFDLLAEIMTQEGYSRFETYITSRRELSDQQVRRVIAAFLDKFALEDAVEEELSMPGWSEALVQSATEVYDEDVAYIGQLPGIDLILP
ncbi:MAG: hypothetical protein AAF636_12235 [Pseudomonadota bacterium]